MIQVINKYGQLKTITISITSSGVTDVTASLPIMSTGGATPNISLGANSITNSYFRQSSGLSIVGRSVNSVGNVADIIASTNYTILRRTGTSIGFGTLVAEHLNPTYTNGYVLSTDGSGNLSWIASVGTPSHNSLSGLQGGTPTEYYHLTAAQHTIATQAASSTLNGYLTSADWTTFNSKQNALGFTPEDVSNKATNLTSPDDTKYPTTLAVKTALDLKANLQNVEQIIRSKSNGTFGSHTGDTAETVIAVIDIDANEFEAGDWMTLFFSGEKNASAGNITWRLRAGVNGNTSDFQIALLTATSVNSRYSALYRARPQFLTGNQLRIWSSLSSANTDISNSGTPTLVSLTPTSAWKLTLTAQLTVLTETASLTGYRIGKIKSF